MNTLVEFISFGESGRRTRLWDGRLDFVPREGEEVHVNDDVFSVDGVVHMLGNAERASSVLIYLRPVK